MLLVFLAGVTPKEYLHTMFCRHHDTVDSVLKKGEFVIGNRHNHCTFLSFAFGPFVATDKQIISFKEVVYYTDYLLPFYSRYYFNAHKVISLRGPPANFC
jgi:hypothetical protein